MRTPLLILGLSACAPEPPPPVLADLELPGGERFTLHPPVVGQGTDVRLTLDSLRSSLSFESTTLDLANDGLELASFAVLDGFTATAELSVAPDAPTGPLDATLVVDGSTWVLEDALTVIEEHLEVDPGQARMGEVASVRITGVGTDWEPGTTWARFGQDVQTVSVEVESPTSLVARIAVAGNALPGDRDVVVESGGTPLVLYGGFTVDRVVLTASFDPPVVSQGEEVDVVIEAVNTHFDPGFAPEQVQFWRQTSPIADFTWLAFEAVSDTRIEGRMKVSNAASAGFRDVFLDGAAEDLLVQDAFEVLPVAPDPLNAFFARGFDVRRTLHADGSTTDDVVAFATFIVPLDPPCGPPFSPPSGPVPFDIEGVFVAPTPPEAIDCPEPLTIDAGEHVFFESPTNVVTLHRDVSGPTGQIVYRGRDLTLADYHFGQTYSIRVSGSPDGIPAFTVDDAQPTVPMDYRVTTPLAGTTHDRFEPLPLAWTPAGVYPTGLFTMSVTGTLDATGQGAMAAVLPFDDGTWTFGSGTLSQLAAGPVRFQAISAVEGRIWQLPVNGWNHQGDSTLVTTAAFTLD